MENRNGDSKMLGRRRTLQMLGMGIAAGGAFVIGCNKDNNAAPGGGGTTDPGPKKAAASCDSPIDEASTNLRKALQYKDRADDQAKSCSGCAQYTDGQFGSCGGCKLIPGPVRPKGGCLSFAPKEGGAATPT